MMDISAITKDIFHALKEGILIIDTSERVVFANQSYLDFIGKTEKAIIGKPLQSFRASAQLPKVVATGKRVVHMARTEDSDEQVYFVNMYPIFTEGKIISGISIVIFADDAYHVKKALEDHEAYLQSVMNRINEVQGRNDGFDALVTVSPASVAAKELAMRIAATDATVLLESESGTGKEVYARAIHNASHRRQGPFLAVNCASFNSALLESELFGYMGGAFTGAEKKGKVGIFEAARGGTLFLDEISEVDFEFQSKLLRALQEHRIRPVGGTKEIPVDVRIICACNADLQDYVQKGKFRKDLYYRINIFTINIPPLRERKEDIPQLVEYLLGELSEKIRVPLQITDEAMECLLRHDWPGNVRELRNILEFGAYLSENGKITETLLPGKIQNSHSDIQTEERSLAEKVREFERNEINRALEVFGNGLEGKNVRQRNSASRWPAFTIK